MKERNLNDTISITISIPTAKYKGEVLGNQRYGKGKETWDQEKRFDRQEYNGNFVYDSLHGHGNYTWNINNKKKVYEGLLYTSKLEGYGRLSNDDNTYFEGLFRKNSRFGPGVFTNANGTQDVGMWYGRNLMRLCVIVKPEWIPRLAHSSKAKVHLLRYKTLVKICADSVDYAEDVFNSVEANDEVMQQSHKLYNSYVKHPKSLFFNTSLYEQEYFLSKDCYIEIAADPAELLFNTPENEKSTDSTFCIKAENEFFEENLATLRINELKDEIKRIDTDILKFEEVRESTMTEIPNENQLETDKHLEKKKKSICWDTCQFFNEESDNVALMNDLFNFDLEYYNRVYNKSQKALTATEDAIKILEIKKKNLQNKVEYEEYQLNNPILITPKQFTKKVLITDLLAWNNEETLIKMRKHAFLHRNFETAVSFCVAKVLNGNRNEFKEYGNYESDCIKFLSECSNGCFNSVSNLLVKYDLNPDMCDAGGNTGMMFAAARDRHRIIKTLVHFGGNVDGFNDECLTPLSLCILRYLAVQNNVSNWEAAFLFPTYVDGDKNYYCWRPQGSSTTVIENEQANQVTTMILNNDRSISSSRFRLEALSEVINSSTDILEVDFNLAAVQLKLESMMPKDLQEAYLETNNSTNQPYLFKVDCVHPEPPKKEKTNSKKRKLTKKEPVIIDKKLNLPSQDVLLQDKLRMIYETITLLLDVGADPNIAEVPMPILLMSLFTKNLRLIEDLLLKKANPNVTTADDELTGIHILASLPPSEILVDELKLLIKYDANPNLAANVQHWIKEKKELIGDHTLEKTDAGHVPLSIAVLRGNVKLVRALLETGKVDPNCLLGEQMGVPLTVYILNRYKSTPSLIECENVIRMLEQFGANPFNSTGERGNVIEFAGIEQEEEKKDLPKQNKQKLKNAKPKKESKPGLIIRSQIKLIIESVTEDVLLRHIKGWVLKYLYQFTKCQNYYDETAEQIAKFISIAECVSIMQIIFYRGEIPIDTDENYETLYDLVEFVINANCPSKDDTPTSFNVDIHKLLENFEFTKLPSKQGYLNLPQPEVDEHSEKYIVCFYCYKRLNCQLFRCPECKLIYYCSEECNALGIKYKSTKHKCSLNFYANSKNAYNDDQAKKPDDHELPLVNRYIKPDQKRRLHLTRNRPMTYINLYTSDKMKERNLNDTISITVPIPTTKYKGEVFGNQRYGKGTETWNQEKRFDRQEYNGNFVYDSLHGHGNYTWNINNKKKVYEGLLYTSKLEGYGRLSNDDNTYFEGLFRKNSRFGPGVFTNANGTQDVGMWYGRNLMRLCVIVKPEWIPRLAHSSKAKVHLLRYKTLVKICADSVDYAEDVLNSVEANDEVMQQSHKLYNSYVKHPKSLFFNTSLYEQEYFLSKDCYIEIAADPAELLFSTPENEKSTDSTFCIKAENEFFEQNLATLRINELKDEIKRIDTDILKFEKVRESTMTEIPNENQLETDKHLEKKKKSICWDTCQFFNEESDNVALMNDLFNFDLEYYNRVYNKSQKALNATEDAIKILEIKKKNLQNKVEYEEYQLNNPILITPKQCMKKVLITDLLAWNNEETLIKMMKHAFLHRNFETAVSFCVAKVLNGNRNEFKEYGNYESDCIKFLSECSNGCFYSVSNLLVKYDLNPDMCDAGGNTGMMFAAARDRHKIIKTLVDFGGNVDGFNDECLTPLSLCILRYLAVQNNVFNWEAAFLFPTYVDGDKNYYCWRPQGSSTTIIESEQANRVTSMLLNNDRSISSSRFRLEALSEVIGSTADILEVDFNLAAVQLKLESMMPKDLQEAYLETNNSTNQPYLFKVDCVHPEPPKKEKNNSKKRKLTKKEFVIIDKKLNSPSQDVLLQDKLRMIYETITLLLDVGADPNIAEVPMPTLLMSLFTKNLRLIEDLLLKKANPNVTTADDELTGIHILASLPPSEILVDELKLLIKYDANPNLAANVQHWIKEKKELIGDYTLEKTDAGKMPLHLLTMRFDFQSDVNDDLCKMANALIESGALSNIQYLGHVPLSIAVLRGNVKLVRALLETGKVDPNCLLGEQMGVPLTVYILNRYKSTPSLIECENVIRMLEQFGANPFNSTGGRGNVIEFAGIEQEEEKKELPKQNKKKVKNAKPKKESKPGLIIRSQIKLIIESVTEDVLLRHIKGWVLKYLYHFTKCQNYYDEIAEQIAKFISIAECISIMQIIFYRGVIPVDTDENYETLYDLVEFVINANCPSKDDTPTSFNVDIHKLLENFQFTKLPSKQGYLNLPQPEVDEHSEKYIVCFYCYKRLNCQLFRCPKCKLIYYCSEECNALGIKYKSTKHKCSLNFYANLKKAYNDDQDKKPDDHELPLVNRYIKPDQKRRLHLTRKRPERKNPATVTVTAGVKAAVIQLEAAGNSTSETDTQAHQIFEPASGNPPNVLDSPTVVLEDSTTEKNILANEDVINGGITTSDLSNTPGTSSTYIKLTTISPLLKSIAIRSTNRRSKKSEIISSSPYKDQLIKEEEKKDLNKYGLHQKRSREGNSGGT
ncbi:hypothetical protein RN001_012973 [Aquatica leii]|uniref:Ankyrin repeat and MYND domain-containing protein 1 n=1 Tax=Aquatica leii TaxID=1421715 RepID=A0AAN7SLC5_9COLE|nr:hypothetical protein RN001_012973 [Aquatica leii]